LRSDKFTQAIEIEPTNYILYSNRSAAYASKKDYENALKDADKVTEIKPDWAKGWGRKGAAKHGLGDLIGALDAYEEGLKLDPNNAQNKSGLASVQRAIDAEAKEGRQTVIPKILRKVLKKSFQMALQAILQAVLVACSTTLSLFRNSLQIPRLANSSLTQAS
jgi:tetratricopeptide (TPR) repeat protein